MPTPGSINGEREASAMKRIEASVLVNAPIEEVFAYASDWRRWEEWWQGVSNFRPTTTTDRGNGTRYAYKAWIAGMSMNLETEIHDFAENVGWKGIATKGPPHRTQWVFEPKDEKTKLTYILEYDLPWPILGPILDALLMRPGWQRMLTRSLENLKIYFEQVNDVPATER
jgi:uncharacterized membrane protein